MSILSQIKIKYFLNGTYIRVLPTCRCKIDRDVTLKNCHIIVGASSELIIEDGVVLENVNITLTNGQLHIGRNSIIKSTLHKVEIIISDGQVNISDHVRLSCKRIWCRFGGKLTIGQYTNINDFSEVRCDKSVKIGSFNQISYNVRIWDSNTHSMLPLEQRRKLTIEYFPSFGYEEHRPPAKPVNIGNDCWIGEYAAVLKGTSVGNGSVVGFRALLTNQQIPDNSTVINRQDVVIRSHD